MVTIAGKGDNPRYTDIPLNFGFYPYFLRVLKMIQVDSCIIFERMWQVGSFTIQEVPTPKKWGESKKQVDMLLGDVE